MQKKKEFEIEIIDEEEELTKILTQIWGGMNDYDKYSETEVKLLPSEMKPAQLIFLFKHIFRRN